MLYHWQADAAVLPADDVVLPAKEMSIREHELGGRPGHGRQALLPVTYLYVLDEHFVHVPPSGPLNSPSTQL